MYAYLEETGTEQENREEGKGGQFSFTLGPGRREEEGGGRGRLWWVGTTAGYTPRYAHHLSPAPEFFPYPTLPDLYSIILCSLSSNPNIYLLIMRDGNVVMGNNVWHSF